MYNLNIEHFSFCKKKWQFMKLIFITIHPIISAQYLVFFYMCLLAFPISCGPRQMNYSPPVVETEEAAQVTKQNKTERRVAIRGTHCSIVPPEGFKPASDFIGLINPSGIFISITDLSIGNYYKNAATFNRQNFEEGGITVFNYQETTIDKYLAKIAVTKHNDNFNSYSLVFGDSTFCVMVMAVFPADDPLIEEQLKQSLVTFSYDKKRVIDPLEVANFVIDDSESNFKLLAYSGGMYTYGLNSIKATKIRSKKSANIIVLIQLPDPGSDYNFSEYIKERLIANGLRHGIIKNESHESINGYKTYQAEIYGDMHGISSLIYIVYFIKLEKAIMMQGTATTDFPASLKEFKQFAQAIKIKP